MGPLRDRGIVISPGFKSSGPDSFTVSTIDVPRLLRQCLLYWDRIDWPDNNLVSVSDPDADFLASEGILQRTRMVFTGAFSGDLTPVFAQGQLKVLEQLERREPGVWSLAQSNGPLSFPGQSVVEQRAVEVQLYEALPVPAETIPFADILEFRRHYASELLMLRSVLDEMYVEIIESRDSGRVRTIIMSRLSAALADVESALRGRSIATWRASCSVELKTPDIARNAAFGVALARQFGMPIAIGAFAGAVASAVRVQITRVPVPDTARTGPFAYVYHARRELAR